MAATTDGKNGFTKNDLVWTNIIGLTVFHLIGFYGIYIMFTENPKGYTKIFGLVFTIITTFGITAGAHRLWSHRSYKAKAPLRLFLVFLNTCVFQASIIHWSRDHRSHHKYTETHADPHNINRGFFFSHIGWPMLKKHPEVLEKGNGIDLSDLYNDPFLRFQHKYYHILMPICCFLLPTVIPVYFWDERWSNALCINMFRYLLIIHSTMTINSVAHRFGFKKYDRFIRPADSLSMGILTFGEGFHNFHHTFPWDYRSAEDDHFAFNVTRGFIDLCAKMGLAYDLKVASEEVIKARVNRTGDGAPALWGWGDKDFDQEDFENAIILQKEKCS